MSEESAIEAVGITKGFAAYARPSDRLKLGALGVISRFAPSVARRSRVAGEASTFWALKGVSLSVRRGETIGIVGRNGSGKSTLLQIVCGTLAPSAGTLSVNGKVAALLELGSGFDVEYTGRENIYLNAQLYGLTRSQIDARYDSIAAFADIGEFIDQPVKTYSSGMFVRLAFAVIAHVDADILVIDEALAVGDAFFNQKCYRFLEAFKRHGTILFVSHDTSTIRKLCTRAVWIDAGRVIAQGSPAEVCGAYLEARYGEAAPAAGPSRAAPAPDAQAPAAGQLDVRRDAINASALRNDIRVLPFNVASQAFGAGGARIVDARLVDAERRPLAWAVGGEPVTLRVTIEVDDALVSPIAGFYIKNERGQELVGANTYLTYLGDPVACGAGDTLTAEFSFVMPVLPVGQYFINVAIADGTQYDHVQLHWIHDALPLEVTSSRVRHALVGVPLAGVEMLAIH
ncbi:ABC transporter ATP-binding protein [Burkholderia glumae]|uniref:ABC transporter ATP-binding protein n=1 Tax=Burkholderia glumae TaxID=337 RepID=A0AAP9Y9X4_BURGL|nr:ABC transporter ATP-binding protein [Burkholderia glumae]ACR27926.1 Polysaccharide ABC transporter, ATP-binding protein [Burkholderia glumae BGR1]AJY65471.1 ABC transporter family protein [Burkholderia glumae LMG 2196 = ATCC 33617]KHJ62914.1 ABC transporter ATP-binding protein [Burkholderia glumae]MCM2481096.1 ABC transporter ATP-binding protein [Burkholderia glumae]MCM2508765.1 ABC transporter ATP-binding protein [Burkholderia glumae]